MSLFEPEFQTLLRCLHDSNVCERESRHNGVADTCSSFCEVLEGARLFHVDILTAIWTGCRLRLGEGSRL